MRIFYMLLVLIVACGAPKPPARPDFKPAPPVSSAKPNLPTAKIRIRENSINVEIARKPAERKLGLMFRTSLAPDSGMLFIFEQERLCYFWMKNTYIPLSIAFIDNSNIITNILEMAPEDTTTRYLSNRPVRYALEMNAGWFQAHAIKPGDTVSGIPK
ncbi:hypothetical protein CH330_08610 [candidate division WOR-3 bacterium JGI_Cruoil_03_51_56]|uniref:DUF192 domain-containing protein n=2 Tax=candidate division WOR-3 bacterium JGI_Cruoil_03_51_56 TaxID=1973747 RepID=A0A235BPR8_UNCW3|nr:MAG: hypothetical protein CH330_08610 [candidate division WOR-3 bacterium JGI_Cruoil_03_51_56]